MGLGEEENFYILIAYIPFYYFPISAIRRVVLLWPNELSGTMVEHEVLYDVTNVAGSEER